MLLVLSWVAIEYAAFCDWGFLPAVLFRCGGWLAIPRVVPSIADFLSRIGRDRDPFERDTLTINSN